METLTKTSKEPNIRLDNAEIYAIKLGIGALKRIQDQRRQYPEISSMPLPGETDEEKDKE